MLATLNAVLTLSVKAHQFPTATATPVVVRLATVVMTLTKPAPFSLSLVIE